MALSLGDDWEFLNQKVERKLGVNDGARTRDISDHNRVLYQLSYAHHVLCGLVYLFRRGILPWV